MSEGFCQNSLVTLADGTGSTDGLTAKVSTLAVAATDYIRIPLDRNVAKVDWIIRANKAHTVQKYLSRTNVTGGVITLTDATAVDDGDTFVMNGLTFTAETTENDAVASARKWYHPDQATGAANLATLLANATYGVPGIGAITVTAVDTTDLITIAAGNTPIYQFNQGTSASNEVAWSQTTLASIIKDGAAETGIADNTTTLGTRYEQWTDGWPYAYIGITNNDGAAAMTYSVKAVRYWA